MDSVSNTPTIVEVENEKSSEPAIRSTALRSLLLLLFSLAQFIDIFNISALFAALPVLTTSLEMNAGQAIWVISAYQLTFAAFLLLSGRVSDVYHPKYSFVGGAAWLGSLCLAAGFTKNKFGLIILRALCGLGGALTIPSALNLIAHLYPEEKEQARAIGFFGSSGSIGNMLGLIIGALFVQYTSWSWVFWFAAIMILPIAIICIFIIPLDIVPETTASQSVEDDSPFEKVEKLKGLDIIGVTILTAALILLIFGFTSGTTHSWTTAIVLVPVILSFFLLIAFFWYETRIPEDSAALPPKMWFYPNFAVLFAAALLPYLWWSSGFYIFLSYWQTAIHWSPIMSAIRFLPINVVSFFPLIYAGSISRFFGLKRTTVFGLVLTLISTGLLTIGNSRERYWPIVFPAFCIGTLGCCLVFANANIAIFRVAPPHMAGTIGAIFNSALQVGAAVGISIVTSIESNIEKKTEGGAQTFKGRSAALWFVFTVVALELIAFVLFFKEAATPIEEVETKEVEVELEKGQSVAREGKTDT
ncbi:MFS general substrate transporter [Sistotremastrum suecicum HHB10207 ss-3]|uniref:MFS general substrate transporter n=1 Tax=Sistotremastrum suecicum HHB10207 ss-3 TaxID=1314776 RepID=A0A165ZVX9_9AGAM|nr:MFS general substrate transporter [Sistotremastrum suecicum HHB10207 ss-3]